MTHAQIAASAMAAFNCPYRSTLLRSVIWAMTGLSYGFVFLFLFFALERHLPLPWLYLTVAMGTGGVAALLYGSLRLSLLVFIYSGVAAIGYLVYAGHGASLTTLISLGGITGMAVGIGYGLMAKDSRIHCAEAKVIAGALAGALASLIPLALMLLQGELSLPFAAFVLCPATGLIYAAIVRWFLKICSHYLPASVNGAIVGIGAGSVSSLIMWVIFSSLSDHWTLENQVYAARIVELWPSVVATAMAGGFLAGLFRAGIGAKWLDI